MTTAEPAFHRGRHLALSCVALLHGPLFMRSADLLPAIVQTFPWTVQVATIHKLIVLCFAAFIAWLAFAVFDTHSGVTLLPRRWTDVGLLVVVASIMQEIFVFSALSLAPRADIEQVAAAGAIYTSSSGELLFGWLTLAMLTGAIAEELVYRALLLRALESYMNPWIALVLHALVFELVHVFVYGLGFYGGTWFVGALILGYAFQRTRSLAVPVLMHAVHNILVATLVWHLAR